MLRTITYAGEAIFRHPLGRAKARPQNEYARAGFAERPSSILPTGKEKRPKKAGFVPMGMLFAGKGFNLPAICSKAYGERHMATFSAGP